MDQIHLFHAGVEQKAPRSKVQKRLDRKRLLDMFNHSREKMIAALYKKRPRFRVVTFHVPNDLFGMNTELWQATVQHLAVETAAGEIRVAHMKNVKLGDSPPQVARKSSGACDLP